MMGNNPKLDLVNVDACKTIGKILSIHFQDIERKRNSDINQGRSSVEILQKKKNDGQQPQARSCQC